LVCELFAKSGGYGNVDYRFAQLGPQLADLTKLGSEFSWVLSGHVGIDHTTLFFG
jgi:hypothetical protein